MLIKLRANIPEIIFGALLATVLFAMGMLFESSRTPPASNKTQQAANDSRSPIAPEHAADKVSDWLLVGLNLFLVVSTFLLWRANNRSAKVAERALTELEAPVVEVKILDAGFRGTPSGEIAGGRLAFCFANYGRSPAHILEVHDTVASVPIGTTPDPIDSTVHRGRGMPYGIIAPPNGETEDIGTQVTEAHLKGRRAGPFDVEERAVYFMGYAQYADIFQNRFTVGFCLLFDRKMVRWRIRGDERYNYCRKEKGPYEPPTDP